MPGGLPSRIRQLQPLSHCATQHAVAPLRSFRAIKILSGHIDRPQFAIELTDSGWTNRRELMSIANSLRC